MSVKITERFAKTCQVVFHNNYDTCGTITRSSIDYLTPADLESLFAPGGVFADLEAWFKTAFEMKACGTKVNGMYDWIMSGSKRREGGVGGIDKRSKPRNPSLLFPFILGLQESVINTDYWAITTGYANSAYTAESTGPLDADDKALGAAGDRIIRVVSRYGVEMDEKWFRDRDRIFVMGRSTTGVQQNGQWKVLASAVAEDRTYVDVLLVSENAGSSQPYNTAPTSGIVLIGVNNVNDFEKWCNNRPNYDGKKEVPFWWQTIRRTRCVDQNYKEFYARLNTSGVNEAFKRFGDLDLARRNAQDEMNYQKHFVNAFFFQKPINANQTVSGWESLDTISTPTGYAIDPGTGGKIVAKRANFIGVVEQLRACDRYRDLQNNKLNFYEFLEENYRLMRARKTHYGSCTEIDWFTDNSYAALLITAYTEYWKKELGSSNVQFPINPFETVTNEAGFAWRSFSVKFPAGLKINIVTHEFFDDLRDAFRTESMESAGINLWALDFRGTYWAPIASNRKVHKIGELSDMSRIDADWGCVMETLTQEITLNSETGAVVVECPSVSIILQGIRDDVPDTTGKSAAAGGSYTDLQTYGAQ
jgi:hypothetical protein